MERSSFRELIQVVEHGVIKRGGDHWVKCAARTTSLVVKPNCKRKKKKKRGVGGQGLTR